MAKDASGITNKNLKLKKLVGLMLEINGWSRPETDEDILNLEKKISAELKNHAFNGSDPKMGDRTIKKLLGKEYHKGFGIAQTLNPVAKLAGYESWVDYLENSSKKATSLSKCQYHTVDFTNDTETLVKGSFYKMGWVPLYYLELEYLGDCEFKILKYVGTGEDRTNDVISGRWFEVKQEPNGDIKPIIVSMFGDIVSDEIIF